MATATAEKKVPTTLADVNRILSNYGIPQFSGAGFHSAIDEIGANALKMAIVDLQVGKQGVSAYLKILVEKHGAYHANTNMQPERNTQRTNTQPESNTQSRQNNGGQRMEQKQNQPPARDHSNTETQPETNRHKERESLKVFGKNAALTIEEDSTQGGFHTIAIDAASASGSKQYDWTKKIRVQVTRNELPAVLAVFLGIIPNVEFKNHGTDNNKGFAFENQGDKIFGKVFSKEGVRALLITPEDCFYISMLLGRQMQKNFPGSTMADIVAMLRSTMVLKIRTR